MFAALDAIAAKTIATVHADPYELHPKTAAADVNLAPVADPNRAIVGGVLAIMHAKEAPRSIPNAYDRRTDQRPGAETDIPVVEVDPRVQPAGFVDVRPKDILVAADGTRWRVAKTRSDEMGRIFATVNLAN